MSYFPLRNNRRGGDLGEEREGGVGEWVRKDQEWDGESHRLEVVKLFVTLNIKVTPLRKVRNLGNRTTTFQVYERIVLHRSH